MVQPGDLESYLAEFGVLPPGLERYSQTFEGNISGLQIRLRSCPISHYPFFYCREHFSEAGIISAEYGKTIERDFVYEVQKTPDYGIQV